MSETKDSDLKSESSGNSDSDDDREEAIIRERWMKFLDFGGQEKIEQKMKRIEELRLKMHETRNKLEHLKKMYTKDDVQRISENYATRKNDYLKEKQRFQYKLGEIYAFRLLTLKCKESGDDDGADDEVKPQE